MDSELKDLMGKLKDRMWLRNEKGPQDPRVHAWRAPADTPPEELGLYHTLKQEEPPETKVYPFVPGE